MIRLTIEVDEKQFDRMAEKLAKSGIEIFDREAFAKWVFESTVFDAHELYCIIDAATEYAYDGENGVRFKQ